MIHQYDFFTQLVFLDVKIKPVAVPFLFIETKSTTSLASKALSKKYVWAGEGLQKAKLSFELLSRWWKYLSYLSHQEKKRGTSRNAEDEEPEKSIRDQDEAMPFLDLKQN